MTPQQLEILQHATACDEFGRRKYDRNHFVTNPTCADGLQCEALVSLGFMKRYPPSELTGGNHLYRVTQEGFYAIREHSAAPPKLTRSQKRYQQFIEQDSGLTFGEWLKVQTRRRRNPVA